MKSRQRIHSGVRRACSMRPLVLLSLCLSVLVALPCRAQNSLRIFETRDVDGYDPFTLSNVESFRLMGLIFAPMVELNAERQMKNRLATEVIQDGRLWTIHLSPDVYFAKGDLFTAGTPEYRQVTAEDVEQTYKVFVNSKTEIRTPTYTSLLETYVSSIKAIDPQTVQVQFRPDVEPYAGAIAFPIAPKKALRNTWIDRKNIPSTGRQDDFITNPYGAGYYYVDRIQTSRVWQLRRNNRLPDSVRASIENLYFYIQPNYDSDLNDFANGNFSESVCIPDVPPEKIVLFKDNTFHESIELRAMRYNYIAFNIKRPVFKDPLVRRALSCAIDREQLLGVYQGQGNPVTGPFPYVAYERCDTCQTPYQVFDPGLADALLEQAGWHQGPSGWRTNQAGNTLQIELTTYAETRSVAAEVAQKVKGFWERVGVKTEVLNLTWAAYIERVFREQSFDAVFGKWEFARNANPTPTFKTNGSLNFVSYSNPTVDSLLRLTTTIRQDSAIYLYHQIHAQIAADAPYAFLYTINRRAVITKRVEFGPYVETWNFLRRINKWSIPY